MGDSKKETKIEKVLREVWYDPEDGFGSLKDTYKLAIKRDPSITQADVKRFMDAQESRQRKRGKKLNSYVADFPCQQLQIDVADWGGELAKDLSGLLPYAQKLVARLREVGGKMDVGAAGTYLRTQQGFSDALKTAKIRQLREFLDGFDGWTIEGDARTGGKTTLALVRRKVKKGTGAVQLKEAKGASVRYALIAVDVFSKLAAAEPIGSKQPKVLRDAFAKMLPKFGSPIGSIYSDDGGEFQKEFASFLSSERITHHVTRGHAPFVERLIRTVKRMIFLRQENAPQARPWHDYLETAISKYNRQEHRSTGFIPLEAQKDENARTVHAALVRQSRRLHTYPPLQVGDQVRVLRKAGKVGERKESWNDWSAERRTIARVDAEKGLPTLYVLEGATRTYMRHELLKMDE